MISASSLSDFYSINGVKMFPNTGRELEVEEEPEPLYKYHQMDTSTCSEAGK